MIQAVWAGVVAVYELGGPVIAILLGLSVVSTATILWKLWQFLYLGVGRHSAIRAGLRMCDAGDFHNAASDFDKCTNRLGRVFANSVGQSQSRTEAEADVVITRLETGFKLMDSIAQVSPLLGLFGTVLGMIDAFQAMQQAGANVDPSLLAGGIWVALMTTAAGLAVAIPTTLVLTFFETRVAKERAIAILGIETIYSPKGERDAA
ncbi:flagellar motor protein MotA [Marivivens niveibacter]|uniref:Flagellar motor protein MotA n=1 Tax=Marivivens niveibacter TaxID=1930667 RepID=A0A251WUF8_9RHOB|nr:MotA/TolQ/ExbB proton channel family protein [Marivivens niveibacter]OUD08120.1 flagellar motor protein MotA [Marivivens niveibacter]